MKYKRLVDSKQNYPITYEWTKNPLDETKKFFNSINKTYNSNEQNDIEHTEHLQQNK